MLFPILPAIVAISLSASWFVYLLFKHKIIEININDSYGVLLPSFLLLSSPFILQLLYMKIDFSSIEVVDILRIIPGSITAYIAFLGYSKLIKNKLQEKQLEVILDVIQQIENTKFKINKIELSETYHGKTYPVQPSEVNLQFLQEQFKNDKTPLFITSNLSKEYKKKIRGFGTITLLPKQISVALKNFKLSLSKGLHINLDQVFIDTYFYALKERNHDSIYILSQTTEILDLYGSLNPDNPSKITIQLLKHGDYKFINHVNWSYNKTLNTVILELFNLFQKWLNSKGIDDINLPS